jgi:hypothetical protein
MPRLSVERSGVLLLSIPAAQSPAWWTQESGGAHDLRPELQGTNVIAIS